MERNRRNVAYLRVSSKTQNVDSQRNAIEKYAEREGIAIGADDWYIDDGVSGATMDRPKFRVLHTAIARQEIATLVLYDLDRLARNALEGLKVLHEWLSMGVRLSIVTLNVDLKSTVGQMVATLLLHIAQLQREQIRERQRLGIEAAKAKQARANELHKEGRDIEYIAAVVGEKPATVAKMIAAGNKAWWKGGGRPPAKISEARIRELIGDKGLSVPDAAAILRVSPATLRRRLRVLGGASGLKGDRSVDSEVSMDLVSAEASLFASVGSFGQSAGNACGSFP
ncbi:MAG: recombinase family protein [Phycisphaerae bacterium]|nr:recombinase family protein [Phycisphaerae bacterium]